jgi:hypothetical protein
MEKCIFIGTCQVVAISNTLKTNKHFRDTYIVDRIYQVHTTTVEEIDFLMETKIKNTDLIICQPISSDYKNGKYSTKRLMKNKPDKCQLILIPFAYFDGYFPHICYMNDMNGNKIEKNNISYHDKNILNYIVNVVDFKKIGSSEYIGKTHNECYHVNVINKLLTSQDYYSSEDCIRLADESISNLKMRESFPYDYNKPVDIIISDYIKDNYKKYRLFNTMNHPSNILLNEMCKRILLKLGYQDLEFDKFLEEQLGDMIFPIYDSIQIGLKLEFPVLCKIKKSMSFKEYVMRYVHMYFHEIKLENVIRSSYISK